MQTAIGQRLRSSPGAMVTASAVGLLAVAADLALFWWNGYPANIEGRGALALVALAAHVRLTGGDLPSVGLRFSPVQGWWYWVRAGIWIGAVVFLCIVAGLGAWILSGHALTMHATAPADIGGAFLRMCVFAPIFEEAIYRLALCVPVAALLGPWWAIAASGLAFGGLHLVYGNASPENLVGGFFLAWAYLKSESIAVPVLLHSLGNLCALAAHVGAWYLFRGGA